MFRSNVTFVSDQRFVYMRKYSNKYKLMISTANAFLRTRARAAMSLLYRQVFGDFSSSTRGIGQVCIFK